MFKMLEVVEDVFFIVFLYVLCMSLFVFGVGFDWVLFGESVFNLGMFRICFDFLFFGDFLWWIFM